MPPSVPIAGPVPPLVMQLQTGSPTAGSDCALAVAVMALAFASGNALRPTDARPARAIIRALRQRMTPQSFWPATSITNSEEALEDDMTRVEMARKGLSPIVATRFLPGTHDQLRAELRKGRFVELAVQYGRWNDIAPQWSGDRAFRRDHMVGLLGIPQPDARGREWVRLFDPTHDARRAGIPKGPVTVPLDLLLDAADSRDGIAPGHASFLSVRRSKGL